MKQAAWLGVVIWVAVAPTATAQGNRCDRACLVGISNQYIEALAAKDPAKAGLAASARYSENGQRLRVGDGLWHSTSDKGTYKSFEALGQPREAFSRIENGNHSTNARGREGQWRPDPKTATNYSGMWTCREQFESGLLQPCSSARLTEWCPAGARGRTA